MMAALIVGSAGCADDAIADFPLGDLGSSGERQHR